MKKEAKTPEQKDLSKLNKDQLYARACEIQEENDELTLQALSADEEIQKLKDAIKLLQEAIAALEAGQEPVPGSDPTSSGKLKEFLLETIAFIRISSGGLGLPQQLPQGEILSQLKQRINAALAKIEAEEPAEEPAPVP